MAQRSSPSLASPWAPVDLKECPLILSNPDGDSSGVFSMIAADLMTSVTSSLLVVVPSRAGKRGRSGCGPPEGLNLPGNLFLQSQHLVEQCVVWAIGPEVRALAQATVAPSHAYCFRVRL